MRGKGHRSGGRDEWGAPLAVRPPDAGAAVLRILDEVLDPELPIGLVELGLIRSVDVRGARVRVDLTFTATACPCMEFIRDDITERLGREPWVEDVELIEVWDPPWTADQITLAGREKLRQLGVTA